MKFDAVIFDIDNVLIDTRASYTDCIRKTVEDYLVKVLNFQPSRYPLLSRRDVEEFKSLGGFNDDWDACYGLILYLLSLKTRKRTIHELRQRKAVSRLTHVGPPLQGRKKAERLFGKQKSVSIQNIAKTFQRYYLTDFMWNEKPILSRPFLKRLKGVGVKHASSLRFGIVTGRNREEAVFALRRFQIEPLMDAMVTTDDIPHDLKKPHPYGLLKIASKLGPNLRYLYVGDLPDDILAARRAKPKMRIASCGFLAASIQPQEMKRELMKAKADFVCEQPKELLKIALREAQEI